MHAGFGKPVRELDNLCSQAEARRECLVKVAMIKSRDGQTRTWSKKRAVNPCKMTEAAELAHRINFRLLRAAIFKKH